LESFQNDSENTGATYGEIMKSRNPPYWALLHMYFGK